MVDIDFLDLIAEGAENWNRWRTNHPDAQPDLSAAYLFGQALAGFDLSGVNLSRACLIGANLRKANLSAACLQGVYASGADFSGADLSGADLSGGNFSEANFSHANLLTVQAQGASLANARLEGAHLGYWQTDLATALDNLGGSYIYTGDTKSAERQRQPRQGAFQPGELAVFIRQLPDLEPAAIAPKSDTRQRLLVGLGTAAAIALTGTIFAFRENDAIISTGEQATAVSADELARSPDCQASTLPTLPVDANRYRYENDAIYYGKLIDGQPADGRGIMVYASGNRYDGEYANGQRSGCGTFTFINGRSYVGQFEADQFSGQGIWTLENGDRYIGEFKDNQCSGQGTFVFADGSSKSGVWTQGKLSNDDLSCDQGDLSLPSSPNG